MSVIRKAIFVSLFSLVAAMGFYIHGQAQTQQDSEAFPPCNGEYELNLTDTPREAMVTGTQGKRVHFFAECLNNPKQCRQPDYIIPNDRVLVYKQHKGWACSSYFGKRQTTGWLPEADLKYVPPLPVGENGWVGHWQSTGGEPVNSVCIAKLQDQMIRATGDAYYRHYTGENECVHVGNFSGPLKFQGSHATYQDEEDDCKLAFYRFQNRLLMNDIEGCGGANVSFTGVYQRFNKPCKP